MVGVSNWYFEWNHMKNRNRFERSDQISHIIFHNIVCTSAWKTVEILLSRVVWLIGVYLVMKEWEFVYFVISKYLTHDGQSQTSVISETIDSKKAGYVHWLLDRPTLSVYSSRFERTSYLFVNTPSVCLLLSTLLHKRVTHFVIC